MRFIKFVFIHCTATIEGRDYQTSQILGWFRARGWRNPGYHYVVHLNGKVERLLHPIHIANGVKYYNQNSIHIAYIGGLDENFQPRDTRTKEQKETLLKIVNLIRERFPNIIIKGHNEVAKKDCPCFNVQSEYGK